jgi:allantoin racemase
MGGRLLWINPVGSTEFDAMIKKYLNSEVGYEFTVDVTSFKKGPLHLEYSFYEALVGIDILKTIYQAEQMHYDAAIIGCFYDPFLFESRELVNIPVTAPAESAMHIASLLASNFSIIVGRKKWIPQMQENVFRYEMDRKLVSFESVDLGVLEFQKDRKETEKRLTEAAERAITKGAESIILGCTIELGFFRKLQKKLEIPVIDAVLAPLKYAEFLVEIKNKMGWQTSKKGRFESPPASELKNWNLLKKYGFE